MQKAVIYSRVSSDEQAKDHRFSLGTQKSLCQEEAEKQGYQKFQTDIPAKPEIEEEGEKAKAQVVSLDIGLEKVKENNLNNQNNA